MLDSPSGHFPYSAVSYLQKHSPTKEIEEKIISSLGRIDNSSSTPLFYAVVAENHLFKNLIDSLINLFTSKSEQTWEMMEEQGNYLLQKLAQRFPDIVMKKVMAALDKVIDQNVDADWFYLFEVFPFVDKRKYIPWYIKTMQKEFELNDVFLKSVMYLGIPETIPHIRKVLEENYWNSDEVNIEELEESFSMLIKGKFPKKAPQPYLYTRKDWGIYYLEIEKNSISKKKMEALSRVPFPYMIIYEEARNEECYCGKTNEKGKKLKYKDCCFAKDAALVNLPRFTKDTLPN